jgi:hypothetical protein
MERNWSPSWFLADNQVRHSRLLHRCPMHSQPSCDFCVYPSWTGLVLGHQDCILDRAEPSVYECLIQLPFREHAVGIEGTMLSQKNHGIEGRAPLRRWSRGYQYFVYNSVNTSEGQTKTFSGVDWHAIAGGRQICASMILLWRLTFPLSSMSLMKRWHGDGVKFEGYIWLRIG